MRAIAAREPIRSMLKESNGRSNQQLAAVARNTQTNQQIAGATQPVAASGEEKALVRVSRAFAVLLAGVGAELLATVR